MIINPKKHKNPEKIGNLVGSLFSKWQGQTKSRESFYQGIWQQVVGERVAKHTRVEQIRGKQLIVIAESSVWMNELTFLKEKIKIKAKNHLFTSGITIDEVVFKLGK